MCFSPSLVLWSDWTILLKPSQKPLSLGQTACMEKIQPKQLKSGKAELKLKHILLMEKCWMTSDRQSPPLHLAETHGQSIHTAYHPRSSAWVYVLQTANLMYKNIHPSLYTCCIAPRYTGFLAADQLHHSPDVILAYTTSSILLCLGKQYSPRLFLLSFFFPFFFFLGWLLPLQKNQRQPHTFVSVFHFVLLQKLKRKALEGLSSAQVRKQLFTMKKKPVSLGFLS